ncbi:MAG TPA: DUF2252 domain-containing protein [Actinophytocola sp.]|jgi:uncharacterized protein (DUF2252 family)|nr:DUF2252 domain-containing protein [Actinophytocola sp.]
MVLTTEHTAETLTRDERAALGRAARSVAPRSSHAEFSRDPAEPEPLALLADQDATRVRELVPIRYGRMSVSPFTYFRGAALPMASDLAATPQSGITVQACGDAHLMNFGVFASPERRIVFDINDFDETLPGPWEWDVKRLATSLEIAGRDNGFTARQCRAVVVDAVAEYRRAMREFAGLPALEVWYAHADAETVRALYASRVGAARRKTMAKNVAKAQSRDNLRAMQRFAEVVDGSARIVPDPPIVLPLERMAGSDAEVDRTRGELQGMLEAYRGTLEPERRALLDRYRIVDMAHKVVGVGSVGTRCWILLLLGRDSADPLLLQAKEASASVLERFAGRSRYGNAGRRVVVGQRLMQTVSDIFLGWLRVTGLDDRTRDFYVRQLRDWKGSADVASLPPRDMRTYGRLCAWTLARAHARTGDDIAIAAYLGNSTTFEHAIGDFAAACADQNERDHAALLAAIGSGAVEADASR